MSPFGAAGRLIPPRAGRVRVPGEIDGGETARASFFVNIPMYSGVRTGQIIVPLYKGAWSDCTTLLLR